MNSFGTQEYTHCTPQSTVESFFKMPTSPNPTLIPFPSVRTAPNFIPSAQAESSFDARGHDFSADSSFNYHYDAPNYDPNFSYLEAATNYPTTNICSSSKSISEIKRHLTFLERPINYAESGQAEITFLIGEIKSKVNSLEIVMKRDDFDRFTSKFDFLLKQVELNSARPCAFEHDDESEYLYSDEYTIGAIKQLIDANVCVDQVDRYLEYIRNNANQIISALSTQMDSFLSKTFNFNSSHMSVILDSIDTIVGIIKQVLSCLEYSKKDYLSEETLTKLMQHLLPVKMLVVNEKFNRNSNQIPYSNFKHTYDYIYGRIVRNFDDELFWSPTKWFVNPTALLASILKVIHQLNFDADANCSYLNKYIFLLFGSADNRTTQLSPINTLAMESICLDFGSSFSRFKKSRIELDDAHLNSILLTIYSLSKYGPNFNLLKSTDADVAMHNLVDQIVVQFGDSIWDHFGLVDREMEEFNMPNGGDSKTTWLVDYLKSKGIERNIQTRSNCSTPETIHEFNQLIRFSPTSFWFLNNYDSEEQEILPEGTLSPASQPGEPQTNAEGLLKQIQKLKNNLNKSLEAFDKIANLATADESK